MSFFDQILDQFPLAASAPVTAEERNVVLIPGGMPVVRPGVLQHADAGPPGGEGPPQRVVAVLGPGATFAGIADVLGPRYDTAAGVGGPAAPTLDDLARAIVVYAQNYLPAGNWANHVVGLILPLPIEINPLTGAWIADADRVRALAASFDAAWRPRLRTPPAAVTVPDALDLESAGAALAGGLPVAVLATQLWTQALVNPSEAVLLFLAALRAADRAGPGRAAATALAALAGATQPQLSVLAATRAGNGILRRLAALLANPPAGADPAEVASARTLLDGALRQGGTLVPHLDVPQTAAQQTSRRGKVKVAEGATADPPGGMHRLILGRDVAVGPQGSAVANGKTYRGPAFEGRLALRPYLKADAGHVNVLAIPGMPALVTLLGNSANPISRGPQGHVKRLDSVKARDAGLVTAGLDQWDATGLPALLALYKSIAPDEFDLFFALNGLDVQPGPAGGPARLLIIGPDGTGTVPSADVLQAFFGGTADAHGAVTFDPEWAARFRLAALVSAAYRRVQVTQAAQRIAGAVTDQLTLLAATTGPFPAAPYQIVFDTAASGLLDTALQPRMTTVINQAHTDRAKDEKTLAAMVVDLTGGLAAAPSFAASFADGRTTADDTINVASLGKIMPMYAAYELRFRVRRLVSQATAPGGPVDPTRPQWQKLVLKAIRDVWGPQICETFPEFPELDVRFDGRFPKLDKMFVIQNNGTVDFAPVTAADDATIKRLADGDPSAATTLPFLGWMKSMIRWSNNHAAGTVINTIGYPYINRLLREAGFYDPVGKRGLWLSQNYVDSGWKPKVDLITLSPRGHLHYKATSNIIGTCRQIAHLLTLAAKHKLFDGDAGTCQEMTGLMIKLDSGNPAGDGDDSPIGSAVGLNAGDTVSSKIGLGVPPSPRDPAIPPDPPGLVGYHDCAIINRAAGGISYVAVVLGGYNGGVDLTAFNGAARALDASIKARHP